MNYSAAISDFFKSPKWTMNLLLGGACALIPFVGQIVVLGWTVTGFWGRDDENYEAFPDFDFSHFGKYLERGLWPFLVTFVASLVMIPLVWVVTIPTVVIYFAWTHLHRQLYRLYLSRGGEPVPFSPKLRDTPPPIPV